MLVDHRALVDVRRTVHILKRQGGHPDIGDAR